MALAGIIVILRGVVVVMMMGVRVLCRPLMAGRFTVVVMVPRRGDDASTHRGEREKRGQKDCAAQTTHGLMVPAHTGCGVTRRYGFSFLYPFGNSLSASASLSDGSTMQSPPFF